MTTHTTHTYSTHIAWTGAANGPASDYKTYSREFLLTIAGKPPLRGTADTAFLGDPALHNPEDLLVAALSSCHLLSYLALCANSGVVVTAYEDDATGTLGQVDRNFKMTEVVLRPRVTIAASSDQAKAERLHERAHDICFIARSVNFPVRHEAIVTRA
ncbi:MAG: OsmC family protein [Planctomycetes bacterium]|nr:OsmC family protein [Planctomycetota bacterium]